jgi:flavin-dependent dehydrogenase
MFEVLIIGGGVSGMSCALVLGSAKIKNLQLKNQIFTHQKSSSLRKLFLITPMEFLPKHWARIVQSTQQLSQLYPHVTQIPDEKS